jgi:hypothetical protein
MMFGRESALTIGSGIALGLLSAAASGRILSGLPYEVGPLDPIAFTTAPLVLAANALIATWLPARRATSIAPTVAYERNKPGGVVDDKGGRLYAVMAASVRQRDTEIGVRDFVRVRPAYRAWHM